MALITSKKAGESASPTQGAKARPSGSGAAMAVLLALCGMFLSACSTASIPLQEETATMTLPPGGTANVAPIGDAALEYTAEVTLFLPRHDGARLASFPQEIAMNPSRPAAESAVRSLLNHEGNALVSAAGGPVRLALYGANPVEVSCGVATVNLAASALQLERKDFYLTCQALANTLTYLPGIHYANILVMDKQIGLDIAGALPAGTFTRSVGDDVGASYEQALSRRAAPGGDASGRRLTALATLYYPLAHLDAVMPETRIISFESQATADMALRLLQELGTASPQLEGSSALPLLGDLLNAPPAVTDSPDEAGRLITLSFDGALDDMLDARHLTRASCMASLCYTLTTFLPDVSGIVILVDGEPVQNVRIREGRSNQIAVFFDQSVQRRGNYAAFLMGAGTLYFADESGRKLVEVMRPMPYHQTTNPRALLLELAKGPLPADRRQAKPLMEPGALKDSDIIGFSLKDDTLLVNFAPGFSSVGRGFDEQRDRLLAYGMVNTLSAVDRIRRVSFFVAGEQHAGFSGDIYWAGDFYKNPGLVREEP